MENIKSIVTVGQKVIAHKNLRIGIVIDETYTRFTVTRVYKKSFIAGGIKFTLWMVTDKDAYGHTRKDGKQRAIFKSQFAGNVTIEF